jgi:hypothetical protein
MDNETRYASLPEELKFDPLNTEEKFARALPGYMKRFGELYAAIYERFGDEGLELIREVSGEYGERIARNVQRKRDLKGVAAVGKYVLKVFDMVSDDWKVTEFSEDRMVISVSRCPYPLEQEAVCKAHTHMEGALVSTLDEELEHRVGQCIPGGDPICEHIICRRKVGD